MSVETSRFSHSGDGDPDDVRRRFAFRSADSAADPVDLDDDLADDDVVSSDDEDDDTMVRGSVVDEDEEDAVVADPDAAADLDAAAADTDEPQPTFTPAADAPVDSAPVDSASVDSAPVDSAPDPDAPTLNETDDVPVVPAQAAFPVTEVPVADAAATEAPLPAAAVDFNEPLLGDPVGLRASWQQAQAGFVDDPRAAVADAAELVEHTAQTLIGSLQQRQRALRTQWDNNGSVAASPSTAGELSDTEQLRHLMQDYRSLFNQLCRP
jgi:hypothetical protein